MHVPELRMMLLNCEQRGACGQESGLFVPCSAKDAKGGKSLCPAQLGDSADPGLVALSGFWVQLSVRTTSQKFIILV